MSLRYHYTNVEKINYKLLILLAFLADLETIYMSNSYRCQFMLETSTSIGTDVRYLKNITKELIGDFPSFTSKAHITIMKEQDLTIELLDYFLKKLDRSINQMESVNIDLDGFGVFDRCDTCTLYLKIKPFYLTENWFDHLSDLLPYPINKHHITIARGLTKTQLATLTAHFRNITYTNSFTPVGITVLIKDDSIPGSTFKRYKTMLFKQHILTTTN